jgi:hypothetical protein
MPMPDHTKYRYLVDDPTLTDEQKDEMILAVWGIMSKLVDAIYDGTLDEPSAKRACIPDIKQRNFRRPSRVRKKRKLL